MAQTARNSNLRLVQQVPQMCPRKPPFSRDVGHLTVNSDSIESIREKARSLFDGSRVCHDWDHTERVCRLCELIGPFEGADMEVLRIAAYLHDVGRAYQDASDGTICHAEKGAEIAEKILAPFPLSQDRKANIVHCIRSHRFRGSCNPRTPEARVLFDADKLDAIGAVGVARAFLFAGELGAHLHVVDRRVEDTQAYTVEDTGYREYRLKLSKIKDRILTDQGRRLAKDRHAFMETFFARFLAEYEGRS
ncbi:HD domain-containing protein [Thermodesulfobacteriota bacterium]